MFRLVVIFVLVYILLILHSVNLYIINELLLRRFSAPCPGRVFRNASPELIHCEWRGGGISG
jgi:hypothetical protein